MLVSDSQKKEVSKKMKLNTMPASVSAPHYNLNPEEELQTHLLARATSLSETALKVLHCKRDKLNLEQRFIEDEIAKCDDLIKNIKGDVEIQLETILECCNETYPKRCIIEESHDKSACQSNKRMKLCEHLPCTKSMCQKLDEEARGSAAACLLNKLHHNTTTTTTNYVLTEDHLRVLKQSPPGETSDKDPIPTEDLNLTNNIYTALRKLRSDLVKAYPNRVTTAYHIFSNPMLQKISTKIPRNKEELLQIHSLGMAKVSKYGDRLLETIESTINEYYCNQ